MRVRSFILSFGFLLLILQGCVPFKQIRSLQTEAISHFNHQEYSEALAIFDQSIALAQRHGKEPDSNIYQYAGISAWYMDDHQKCIDYLEKAKVNSNADASTYYYLSKAYLKVDNLSREIINLEKCVELEHEDYWEDASGQLFLAYAKSENWEKANNQWEELSDMQKSEPLFMEGYLKTLMHCDSTTQSLSLAKDLLRKDSKNLVALEVLGLYYYEFAEKSYQTEMKAYERNRTNKQYKQLLSALEKVNENFRISRDHLETLYSIDPQPKYARYLGNIYKRFKNDAKANYYLNKASNN